MRNKKILSLATTVILALIALAALAVRSYNGYLSENANAAWCKTNLGHPLYCAIPRLTGTMSCGEFLLWAIGAVAVYAWIIIKRDSRKAIR